MMNLNQKAKQIFQQNFWIGAGVFSLGLVLTPRVSFQWYHFLIGSLLSGFITGYCHQSLFKNSMHCTLVFYEYIIKLRLENGRLSRWRLILFRRMLFSSLSILLIIAVLSLPLMLQLRSGHFQWLYWLVLGLAYSRFPLILRNQIRGSKAILKRALEVEDLLKTQ